MSNYFGYYAGKDVIFPKYDSADREGGGYVHVYYTGRDTCMCTMCSTYMSMYIHAPRSDFHVGNASMPHQSRYVYPLFWNYY